MGRFSLKAFSPNARYYLVYASLAGIGTGMWLVAFAIYLYALGFGAAFIGLVISAELVAHGAMAFPAGIIGDAFGRKRAFILASLIKVSVGVAILFSREPWVLLALSTLIGAGDSFHGVVGSPFMMENSTPKERVQLFSVSATLSTVSAMVGGALGGLLPVLLAGTTFAPADVGGHYHAVFPPAAILPAALDPIEAMRATLLLVAPLSLVALIPLARIREGPVGLDGARPRDVLMLRHVRSPRVILWLALTGGIGALGFGLFGPLLNVYFADQYGATTEQIGLIVSLASLAVAASFLLTPRLVRRFGRVQANVITQVASVPFLSLIALAPTIWVAAAFVLVRQALARMASPVTSMFAMELVEPSERATTAGVTHAAFDLPSGITVGVAGLLFAAGAAWAPFALAALLYLVSAALYAWYFQPKERALKERERADEEGAGALPERPD